MSGRGVRALGYAGAGAGAFGVAVWALRRLTFGDVDPLGAVIALVSGLFGVAALVVGVRSWRLQQADTSSLAQRLAVAVLAREQRARRQLLGDTGRTIDVRFDFRPAPAHNAEYAFGQGRLTEVAAYYRRLRPRRMVITGAAGAGKTVLAVELMMMLLQDRAPEDPVPVRLSASSWDLDADPSAEPAAAGRLMQRWLVAHLVEVYQLPPRSATALVDVGGILPVVDGLDELDATDAPGYASRAGQALRVFNSYQHYRDKAPLIVTCRHGHYQALTADHSWVQDAARVEIGPVDAVQAREFITARAVDVGRWQSVLAHLDDDRPLAAGLATPWRLTLATLVYEQRDHSGRFLRDPDELTSPELSTADAVRDHLLGLFLPAALQSVPAAQPYDPARAHRWLAVLAGYLDHNTATGRSLGGRRLSGTDIVLHELWPLAGSRRPRLTDLMIIAVIWLVALHVMSSGFSATDLLWEDVPALVVFLLFAYLSWTTIWPQPQRLNLDRLRTSHGRRRLADGFADGFASGFASGFAFGFAFGLMVGLMVGLMFGFEGMLPDVLWLGPVAGVVVGIPVGLVGGLAGVLAFGLAEEARAGAVDPRSIVRDDLVGGLTFGLTVGPAGGLVAGLVGGLPYGLTIGLVGGLAGGFAGGPCGVRYVALLLCTRWWSARPLPWRLGRFLDVCYRAGLVRIAGSGYQFRHRELQDYLARHPVA